MSTGRQGTLLPHRDLQTPAPNSSAGAPGSSYQGLAPSLERAPRLEIAPSLELAASLEPAPSLEPGSRFEARPVLSDQFLMLHQNPPSVHLLVWWRRGLQVRWTRAPYEDI